VTKSHEGLLGRYLQLPGRLETAIAGLDDAGLNLKNEGWSIRQYVHHTVEGELMWQLFLRAILGNDGIEFPIQWYLARTQEQWADSWASDRRAIQPTLDLFHASTRSLAELLEKISPDAWEHFGRVTWPGDREETRLTVRDILLVHIHHMDQHVADIRAIRSLHLC
jgi:hypothetical protein